MRGNIYLWSDPHFHHTKIIELSRPQFSCIEEHDEALVANHNSVVKQNDISLCLGDVVLGSTDYSILERLNGRKWLVLGNHDSSERIKQYAQYFEKIVAYHVEKRSDSIRAGVIFSHVPIHESQLDDRFKLNIHGHLHKQIINDSRYINVCMERINYTPISLDELI